MVATLHKPRRCLLRFLPSRPAPSRRTPSTSILTAYASSNGYCGPPRTVLPPFVHHRPAVQHVQPTSYRIPVEPAGGKNTLLRSPVERPSRRILQHSPWSTLQPRGSWNHGTSRIHADPPPPPRVVLRSPSLDLSTHPPTQGPRPWSHTFQLGRSRRPPHRSGPPMPLLLRLELPMSLPRSGLTMPLLRLAPLITLRLAPPTLLLRLAPLTHLLSRGLPTLLPLGPRHTWYTPPMPPMPHQGTPISTHRPNPLISPPAAA